MSRLPKGPDLKGLKNLSLKDVKFLKDVNVPPVLADLVRDMRDRHLLPLVAVAALAIVAVPLLLANSAPELTGTEGTTGIPVTDSAEPPQLMVVADRSGLRDYRKRLSHLEEKNPFRQHFASPDLRGSQLGGPASGTTATVPTAPAPPAPSAPTFSTGSDGPPPITDGDPIVDVPTGGGPGGDTQVNVETEYVSYEIDVKVARPSQRAGQDRKPRVSIRRGVSELQMLPSEKSPVVVFMGVSADREKALFLVSERVNSVFGDVRCMVGSESCQLLMLEPGLPATFVYGANDKSFRLNVLGIERVTRDKP
jgi:hypothetical protein